MENVGVVIPTKNRPEKLEYCLTALARAREKLPFVVDVGDSSDAAKASQAVRAVCKKFDFVRYHRHHGQYIAAARNFCAQVATAELLINVDDDVYVVPDAILQQFEAYQRGQGWRVVAGSVAFGKDWSEPVVMRPIGYGRKPRPGERPSFLVGAFFLYPRALALACPWNERIRVADDIFVGGLWRCKGVALLFEPQARAFHDIQLSNHYVVEWQADVIYAILFDALVANPNIPRAFAYEFLGFAAGAKYWFRRPKTAWAYVAAWYRGHRALVRDWQYLKASVRQPLLEDAPR